MKFCDCATGAALAYTIIILEFLKTQYGETEGKPYFDTLYGSKETITPEHRLERHMRFRKLDGDLQIN